jgi:hypothetical protein
MSMARAPSLVPSAEVAGRAGGGRAEHERHRLGLEVATFALGREQKSGEAIALASTNRSRPPPSPSCRRSARSRRCASEPGPARATSARTGDLRGTCSTAPFASACRPLPTPSPSCRSRHRDDRQGRRRRGHRRPRHLRQRALGDDPVRFLVRSDAFVDLTVRPLDSVPPASTCPRCDPDRVPVHGWCMICACVVHGSHEAGARPTGSVRGNLPATRSAKSERKPCRSPNGPSREVTSSPRARPRSVPQASAGRSASPGRNRIPTG